MKVQGRCNCAEIPLIIDDLNSPLPKLDSTRLLAQPALDRAASGSPPTTDMRTPPAASRHFP